MSGGQAHKGKLNRGVPTGLVLEKTVHLATL